MTNFKTALTFLLFFFIAAVQTSTFAQVTVSANNTSIRQIIRQIEKNNGYSFFYSDDAIDLDRKTTVNIKNEDMEAALSKLFAGTNIQYAIGKDKQITLTTEKNNESVDPVKKKYSGVVKDEFGEPLIGATVTVKGSQTSTVTDQYGNFTIEVPANATLLITYIGYQPQEIKAGSQTQLQIVLEEGAKALDEVVVVGYGTQKKVNVAGSVSSVSAEKLVQTPSANLTNAIAGRVSGVLASNPNGAPGSGSNLQIRGLSTLNNNSPLFVIDGIIGGDFAQIDPNEVESITVLKDASSAVYGARAANGVFLVTTKRGVLGKPKITYSGLYGIQQPTQYTKMMSPYEYAYYKNQGYLNMGYDPNNPAQAPNFYTDKELAALKSGEMGVDWQKASFQANAMETQHNLSVNGGTEAIRYFLSLGYFDQDGMFENMNFKRYNFRSNIDTKITKHLDVGLNLEARQTDNHLLATSTYELFWDMIVAIPTRFASPYYPDGKPVDAFVRHPVENPRSGGYNRQRNTMLKGVLFFEQRLPFVTPGLSMRGSASLENSYYFSKHFIKPFTMYVEDEGGNVLSAQNYTTLTLTENFSQSQSTLYNISLNYARKFGLHDVASMLLYEQAEGSGDSMNGTKQDFPVDIKDELFASGTANQSFSGSSSLNEARRSLVGRANYVFDSKYIFEFSFRYDGSYRFPKEKRFGFFPSVLLAWRISEEPFFKKSSSLAFVNNLKIRFSKGLIGNDRVNAFQFMDSYSINSGSGPIMGGAPQILINYGVYPNPNITWEKQDNNNVGLDLGLWKGKLTVEMDAFLRKTRDILWGRDRSVPGTFGRGLPSENYAQMQSRGFELTLGHQNKINKLGYSVQLTGTYATNKVTQIDDPSSALDYQKQINRPTGFRVGYEALGFFQSQEEAKNWFGGKQFGQTSIAGDIKYADVDGDGEITSRDQKILSYNGYDPRLVFGTSIGLTWKDFDLDLFFQGAAMRTQQIYENGMVMFVWALANPPSYLKDSWSPDNRDAKYPIAWVDSRSINNRASSVWVKDAAYVRFKSASLGYTFRQTALRNIGIEKLRAFVSGFNLLTWSQFKEFDPEAENASARYYPQQRTINFGVNLTF